MSDEKIIIWSREMAEDAFREEGFMSYDNKAAIYASGAHWMFCKVLPALRVLIEVSRCGCDLYGPRASEALEPFKNLFDLDKK